ncbi:hypothetical protein ILYODFUR_010522 [Ilyodon furcidens]|uniref:Uncharacterized protein n=1 Tax=Ilyodon furcidens TaxID=33524 RepID=A0ABV0UI11_9TELE
MLKMKNQSSHTKGHRSSDYKPMVPIQTSLIVPTLDYIPFSSCFRQNPDSTLQFLLVNRFELLWLLCLSKPTTISNVFCSEIFVLEVTFGDHLDPLNQKPLRVWVVVGQ